MFKTPRGLIVLFLGISVFLWSEFYHGDDDMEKPDRAIAPLNLTWAAKKGTDHSLIRSNMIKPLLSIFPQIICMIGRWPDR